MDGAPLFAVLIGATLLRSGFCDVGRSRVVGGAEARAGQFPHQLSIQCRGSHFCGGSLLNPWTAITAAHCCDKIKEGKCQQKDVRVVAGEHSLSKNDRTEQIRPLMDYIQHDDFKKPKFFDDICLLHFKKPFIQNRHVQTIQLTSKTPYYGTDCYISGWGASSEGSFHAEDKLMFAQVPILKESSCLKPYGRAEFSRQTMVCAGYLQGLIDSCQGDSGGPLVCNGKLVGLVSFGAGCARPGFPGVYTRIENYLQWISHASKLHPLRPFSNSSRIANYPWLNLILLFLIKLQ